MVIMANGTGTKASAYGEVFNHLATWGFISVGNEDDNSRTGASSAVTLDYMLKLNDDPESIFYHKIVNALLYSLHELLIFYIIKKRFYPSHDYDNYDLDKWKGVTHVYRT